MSGGLSWTCSRCHFRVSLGKDDQLARLELDHMRVEHKAWHTAIAAEAHGVTA